ncbi:lysosome-associated membrane glycoprotein 1 [Pelodytes ibericus]
MGAVNATFHNIRIEAYLKQNNYSHTETICTEDVAPTTAQPITAVPTTSPVKPDPPSVGDYTVNGTSGPCILAKMGLQPNITYINKAGKDAVYVFNINPQNVTATGTCTNSSATLRLAFGTDVLSFEFALNSSASKYYLGSVELNATLPADARETAFRDHNSSLNFLQTTAQKSYKCNAEQVLQITNNFSINTYKLQVQPFDVNGNKFAPAVDCIQDENGMLVPIVVGAALAGLVLIVLIAYLIGRKRSHAGYQTI